MANDTALRRRLMLTALDLRPADLGRAMGATPVRVSGILNGTARVREAESRPVQRLFAARARRLFEDGA
jgi:hypothetical protein